MSAPDAAERAAAALAEAGLAATSWSNGPRETYAAHRHGYDKVLVVASGSIVFGLSEDGRAVELAAGDRLDLPAGTLHDAVVGPDGVTCLEAHVATGTLGGSARRVAGWLASPTGSDR